MEYFCPEDLASGWNYVKDGKFVPSTSASMRCSDCSKIPTAPECGKGIKKNSQKVQINPYLMPLIVHSTVVNKAI